MNTQFARLFHFNAIPFHLVESDKLADFIKALCPTYYQHGIPWPQHALTFLTKDVHDEIEKHLQGTDALMANMDGWENEKKQQLKIVTETGKIACLLVLFVPFVWIFSPMPKVIAYKAI